MQDTEQRQKALEEALRQTDELFDMFSKVIRRDWENTSTENLPENSDFSATAARLISKEGSSDIRQCLDLEALRNDCLSCNRCRLAKTRTNTVFGEGIEDRPDVFVIGEGPGETEDRTGRPFTGKAGELLERMLAAISLYRDTNCYISNIVKCRPPQNRDPLPDEKNACAAYIRQQVALTRPKAILCLGKPASSFMTRDDTASMSQLRGRFTLYDKSIPLICTYHPAAVLRNCELRRPVWEDLKKLARFLNLRIAGGDR